VPEPGSGLLVGCGLLGLAYLKRAPHRRAPRGDARQTAVGYSSARELRQREGVVRDVRADQDVAHVADRTLACSLRSTDPRVGIFADHWRRVTMIDFERSSLALALAALTMTSVSPATAQRQGSYREDRGGAGLARPLVGAGHEALQHGKDPGTLRDLLLPDRPVTKPGLVKVNRQGVGPAQFAQISVGASRTAQNIELGATRRRIPRRRTSGATRAMGAGRSGRGAKGPQGSRAPRVTAMPLRDGQGFGATWIFNDKPGSSEIHSGADYALAPGSPVSALADGTVVLAEDLFFTGNAVFIDHGNGLVTMSFHLSEIKVQTGQDVKKGGTLGLVGSTGRVTGPHFHLGVRWHDARIAPQALLDDPAKIPAIGQ
jgi:hypothetical protein